MPKQVPTNPEIRFPANCPILEKATSRGPDMCLKDHLDDTDLDVLGISHCARARVETDFYGVQQAWLD